MIQHTIDVLDEYMILHGHTRTGEFNLDNKITKCIVELNEYEIPKIYKGGNKVIAKHSLKKHASTFFNDFYNLHKIGYLPDNKLKNILNDRRIRDIQDITDVYNSSVKFIHPFKLPIKYNLDSINGGTLVTQSVLTEERKYHKELLASINMYFTNIELPKRVTEVTTASYIHEITHSQLESYKGIIEEYYNAEVISIFNELLYAYYYSDKKVFDELLVNRLNSIFLCFNAIYEYIEAPFINNIRNAKEYGEFDFHGDVKYLISTLKALKMMIICTSDDNIKKYHVINQVNRVFNGDFTVEELLDKIEVNTENSLDPNGIKKLIRN